MRIVIFTLFYCLLNLSCCECDVISLGVVAISLLNVFDVFSVGGGTLLDSAP